MERVDQKLDFQCNVCKKQFNKRHSLKIHIDRVHEKKLDHECLVCQKRFFYLKDLINHLKVHKRLETPSLEYLPEDSREELTKEGRVFVKGFEVTIDLVCMFCFKILATAASAKSHQKLHLDGMKHKQLMESAAFELGQQNVFFKSSRKENNTEAVKKDDRPTSQQAFKAPSEKNQFGNSGTNFFFSCQKCFNKFLSTRLLRNHTCDNQPMERRATTETKELSKISHNKLTITACPQNKENSEKGDYLSTEMPQVEVNQIPWYINGVLVSTEKADDNQINSPPMSLYGKPFENSVENTQRGKVKVLVSTEADGDQTNSPPLDSFSQVTFEQIGQPRPKQRVCIDPETMAKIDLLIEKQEDGFSCKHCEYRTKGKRHMIEHTEKHIEGLEYSCNYCNRIFRTSHNLRDHISRYANCTPKKPRYLKQTFKKYNKLHQMIRIEPGTLAKMDSMFEKENDGYFCKHCEYRSKVKQHMKDHVERHIEGLEYPCNSCDRILRSSNSLRDHKYKGKCARETARSLTRTDGRETKPTRTDGPKIKPRIRTDSPKAIKFDINVKKKPLFLYCNNCDFRTKRFFYIKKHNRTHHKKGIKQEQTVSETLTLIKTEENVLQNTASFIGCDNCNYKATEIGFLRRHINMQHDMQRYHCYECDFKATEIEDLVYHGKTSHDQPVHCCVQCVYHTEREDHLKRHLRSKHKSSTNDDTIFIKQEKV